MFLPSVVLNDAYFGRNRDLSVGLALERFEFLGFPFALWSPLGYAPDTLVRFMREFLGLKARLRMKLHFEAYPGAWFQPLRVDSLVLLAGPRVLYPVKLEPLRFQAPHVRQNTLGIAIFVVREREAHD